MLPGRWRCDAGRVTGVIFLLCLFALFLPPPQAGASTVRVERSVMLPMRDGVRLSTDLYFPADSPDKLPAVLLRTAYSKNDMFEKDKLLPRLVAAGFVVVIQDVRGRYESEGRFQPGRNNRNDGYDTVTWLATQEWSNRKVGSAGCSFLGEMQLTLAAARHPNHVAAFPMAAASGYYTPGRAWMSFDGGVFELAQTAGWFFSSGSEVFYGPPPWLDRGDWFRSPAARLFRQAPELDYSGYGEMMSSLPIADALSGRGLPPNEYRMFATNEPDAEYFRSMDFATKDDTFDVPAVFVDSWYDYGVAETLQLFKLFQKNASSGRARANQFLIVAPSTHCGYGNASAETVIGERPLGDARIALDELQLRWFDYWLKGDGDAFRGIPRVQYYLMGKNEWREADDWPIPGTRRQNWYLGSAGGANSRLGNGTLAPYNPRGRQVDRFVYDPASPVPTLGGQTCCTGLEKGEGAYDQSNSEMRRDVLVYTSNPLTQGMEVTGTLEVVLYVESSTSDTDFTAKLVDVYPDGRAYNIQEGAMRMRYREGFSRNLRMKQDEVYEIHLDLHATSNYFGPGHRIRLEVSSSNFPRWDRNLNTGGSNFDESDWVATHNSVHHGPGYPSRVVLPVVEPGNPSTAAHQTTLDKPD
jgi:hypothetical protein